MVRGELREPVAPVVAAHAIESSLHFWSLAFFPGVDLQPPVSQGLVVGEEEGGVSQLEVAASPDGDVADGGEFQGAVDPSAARPVGGADVPVGVVVEGDDSDRLLDAAKQNAGEIMEVARAIENEIGELVAHGFVEGIDMFSCSVIAEFGPPGAQIDFLKAIRKVPCVIEVQVD